MQLSAIRMLSTLSCLNLVLLLVAALAASAVEGLVKAIESAHQAYDHLVYAPVFSAANADGTAVHMAIQWCLRHKKTSM